MGAGDAGINFGWKGCNVRSWQQWIHYEPSVARVHVRSCDFNKKNPPKPKQHLMKAAVYFTVLASFILLQLIPDS